MPKEDSNPKEDAIEVMGKVVEKFKAGMFSIELDVGKTVLATMAGRLRRNRIKVMNGDRVFTGTLTIRPDQGPDHVPAQVTPMCSKNSLTEFCRNEGGDIKR